jgi:eukaryotic-like serine/threonine-protein kinase
MFAREEWVGKLVVSPHVLKVIVPDRPRRHLYIATEYFDGQTLRQWMRDHPRPEFEAVRGIVEQIAKGLRAFHRKEIIHQDLKPENVMIDGNGVVKIIDFGSARAAGLDEMASPVETPHLVGTIDYTAPEYHRGEKPTNRADIYALGVLAYEMLTGRLPYGKGFASARDVPRLTYVPSSSVRDDIPAWMDAALAKAVHKQPAQRTDALSALVEDLRRPNANLGYDRPRPLLERNPVAVWRTLALAMFAINVVLVFLLAR